MLNYKKLSDKKNYIVYKTINQENKKFNNNIMDLVIRKKVHNIINLSPNEVLLKIEKENLTNKEHLKILNKILKTPIDSNFFNKRTLFELLKLSLLNKDTFFNIFNADMLGKIGKLSSAVSADDNRTALIKALKPMLSEERQQKADEVMKILKIIQLLPLIRESGLLNGLF